MKLLSSIIVLINNTATSSRELDRVAHNRAEDCLEIQSGTDCLANFPERSKLADGFCELLCSRFQFLKQPHILNRDDCLIGESLNKRYLVLRERLDLAPPKA